MSKIFFSFPNWRWVRDLNLRVASGDNWFSPHMAVGVRFFPFGSNLRFDYRTQSRFSGRTLILVFFPHKAEGGGFEPPKLFLAYRISSAAHSSTLPTFRFGRDCDFLNSFYSLRKSGARPPPSLPHPSFGSSVILHRFFEFRNREVREQDFGEIKLAVGDIPHHTTA